MTMVNGGMMVIGPLQTFDVNPEIMQRIIESRKYNFEQQIGETQLNVAILSKAIESFNDPQDVAVLAAEQIKLRKLLLNYTTVNDMVIP